MFDIGMSELLLIGIVALIVVGPKDLPQMFHALGKITAKMRALGREFTRAMNDAARESGINDVAKDLKGVANPKKFGIDKLTEAADKFDKWQPNAPAAKSGTPKPAPAKPTDAKPDTPKPAAAKPAARAKPKAAAKPKATKAAAATPETAKPAPKRPAAKTTAAKPAAPKPAAKKPAVAKPAANKTPAGTGKAPKT